MQLDPQQTVRVQAQVEAEAPAGRDAVQHGVRGQLADADHDVVHPVRDTPVLQRAPGELAGSGDGPAGAGVEVLTFAGHASRVALCH